MEEFDCLLLKKSVVSNSSGEPTYFPTSTKTERYILVYHKGDITKIQTTGNYCQNTLWVQQMDYKEKKGMVKRFTD